MSAARCERAQRTISTSSLASAGSTTAAGVTPSTAKRWQEAASVATRPAVTERSDSSLSVATVMVGKKAERHGKKKDSPRRHRGTEEKQVPRLRPAHSLSWWHRPLACGECKTPARRRCHQYQAGRGSARDDKRVWERTVARSGPGSLGERPDAKFTARLRRRGHLLRVQRAARVEHILDLGHGVEVVGGKEQRHQVALLHAHAVLSGDGAAHLA